MQENTIDTTATVVTIDSTAVEVTTALSTAIVPVPIQPLAVIASDTPQAGDNGAPPDVTAETVMLSIRNDIAEFTQHTNAADHVLQRMAYHILQRHALMQQAGKVDFPLGYLATSDLVRKPYWTGLLDELFGAWQDKKDAKAPDQVRSYIGRDTFVKRCGRAFNLAMLLSWAHVPMTAFDHERGRWSVHPKWFAPYGYGLPSELVMTNDGKPVTSVVLSANDARRGYYINRPGHGGQPINLSIEQFLMATADLVKASLDPNKQVGEANPGRQAKADKLVAEAKAKADKAKADAEAEAKANRERTAALQAGPSVTTTATPSNATPPLSVPTPATREPAAPGSTDRSAANKAQAEADSLKARADAAQNKATEIAQTEADKVAALTPTELGERVPEANPQRTWLIAELTRHYEAIDKLLNMDVAQSVAWADLPLSCQNGMTTGVLWFDRRKGDMPEEAKPATA